MKKLQFIILLTLTFLLFPMATQAENQSALSAKDQLDSLITLHQGDVIYVDFWASWYGPCRKSFPWMNKFHGCL